MSILFNKRKVQAQCELYIQTEKSSLPPNNKYNFGTYVLTSANETSLRLKSSEDACCFYFNSLVSFLNACESLKNSNYSWACVQLYYSLYYSLRSYMGFDNKALVRDNGRLYYLDITAGHSPIQRNNKKYNTDHGGTLNYYKDAYANIDLMLKLQIDSTTVIDWMMDLRETTNYRENRFLEPESRSFMKLYGSQVSQLDFFKNHFQAFDKDKSGTYLITEASAWLAVPYHYIGMAANHYKQSGCTLDSDQKRYIGLKLALLNIKELSNKWL